MYGRRRRRWPRLLVFMLLLLAGTLYLLEATLRPSLEAVIQHTIQIRATEAINRAVLDRVAGTVSYEDLYLIKQNQEGQVTFLQPNTPRINRVAAQVALAVQQEMKKMEDQYFGINLSQVLGSKLFATRGPALTVSVESIGTVRVTIDSRFEQAGLNQTRHITYLKVRAEIQAVTPTFRQTFPVEEQVPLVEGIIVGPVPDGILYNFRPLPEGSPPPSPSP